MIRRKYDAKDYIGQFLNGRYIVEDLGANPKGQTIVKWLCTNCGHEDTGLLNRLVDVNPRRCVKCPPQEYRFSKSHMAQIRQSAARRDYEYNITDKDCKYQYDVQKGLCYFTGQPLDEDYSVDRFDNTKGYTPTNLVITTKAINRMKSDMSAEQFISLCKKVADYYS